ncbi:hypothetical protein ACQPZQ_31830 [Pseudonocardia sp. CA-142604]|uniref:hypothetical protein n=1 Tax=Pseudonocardia sp. CA-142604 TaxID=3240024 RepID=UPI003D91138C
MAMNAMAIAEVVSTPHSTRDLFSDGDSDVKASSWGLMNVSDRADHGVDRARSPSNSEGRNVWRLPAALPATTKNRGSVRAGSGQRHARQHREPKYAGVAATDEPSSDRRHRRAS